MNFYGIVPEFLLSEGVLSEPRNFGGIIKSNAIFFHEPSIYSQFTALGILIEVLEFRRPRYLVVIALGFLVAYSGTGLVLLLLFLPFASLTHDKAGFSLCCSSRCLLSDSAATGIIDIFIFLSRVGEFEEPGSSASIRFVAPMWATAEHFHTASLQALLVGDGPGAAKNVSLAPWFRLFYEYGIIGSFIFLCFLASCLRRSSGPGVVVAAIIFALFFLLTTVYVVIVLCTLNGPRPRRGRIDEISQYRSSLVADAETV